MPASRNDLLAAFRRRYRTVTLPVSGLEVRIQNLNELETMELELGRYERDPYTEELRRDELGRLIPAEQWIREARARKAVATLVDDGGQRLFNAQDVPQLLQLDQADIQAIDEAVTLHLAGRTLTDEEKKRSPTNSSPTPGSDSSTGCVPGGGSGT